MSDHLLIIVCRRSESEMPACKLRAYMRCLSLLSICKPHAATHIGTTNVHAPTAHRKHRWRPFFNDGWSIFGNVPVMFENS